ncbi:MAG: AMP-binding protein [Oscillospiraceae bacterium]|nr:AMP-binding protein [Oscillospiraceae bacterium]
MRYLSFSEIFRWYTDRTPDAPALRYERDGAVHTLSYARLYETVKRRAAELKAEGKTCLGLFADGSLNCVIELFSAVRAGMQVVMLERSVPVPILRGLLPYTDVDTLWGPEALCAKLTPNLAAGVEDGAGRLLFFTSGTTQRAKAVVLTEKKLCASAYNGSELLPLSADDTLLCALPLGHVFGFVCGLLWGLSCGACVALGRGASRAAEDYALFRPTAVSLVPLQLSAQLRSGAFNPELKRIVVGAGDCADELLAAARARGIRVCFGYGLTETSSGVALSLGEDPHAMTVCPDAELSIAPDGEILIRMRTCMMKGYYKCRRETAAVLRGGVLQTGDLGALDENGLLHVTGRKKDMLVLHDGGNLFLPEAEAELARLLPGTDLALTLHNDALTLAVYDARHSDEELLAAIEPFQRARAKGWRIAALARLNGPLPRTATGKVRRWELNVRLQADKPD